MEETPNELGTPVMAEETAANDRRTDCAARSLKPASWPESARASSLFRFVVDRGTISRGETIGVRPEDVRATAANGHEKSVALQRSMEYAGA